ncbi:hypothetical protein [uncultured Eubacterium sp.]|uniref:hypothetical protein n=1 Tax=uncultured Eubacterium sp. TaxID=165185 RepID=UPI002593BE63|nr:hypothetical protein [uncultured Eubacterium sp.]
MKYQDFLEIARYGNENWKGYYTEEEVTRNAKDYYANYKWSKVNKEIDEYTTIFLLEKLAEDWANGSSELTKWLKEMITGIGLPVIQDTEISSNVTEFIKREM